MIKERERFEMLLEEMRDNFKLLAEGQNIITSNMDGLRTDMNNIKQELHSVEGRLDRKIDFVHSSLKNEINVTYMALNDKIEDHIKQPSRTA